MQSTFNNSKKNLVDFWGYLAGLIEADGYIKNASINSSSSKPRFHISIAGHKGQYAHFYYIATKVGMTFSLSSNHNWLRLTWTNPASVRYIMHRMLQFVKYHNKQISPSMFIKLAKFAHYYGVDNVGDYTAYLHRVMCVTNTRIKNPADIAILSGIIGFIDGDGEMAIQIGAKHRGTNTKNIINGIIRITQKDALILQRIQAALAKVEYINCQNVFDRITVDVKRGNSAELRFNAKQNAEFTRLVCRSNFKTPWNALGSELIYVITCFKNCYDLAKVMQYDTLKLWTRQRANLIAYLQLLRLVTRDRESVGIPRLIQWLNQSNKLSIDLPRTERQWLKLLQCLIASPTARSKAKATYAPLDRNLWSRSNQRQQYAGLISSVFIANEIIKPNISVSDLSQLKHRVICYILHAHDLIKHREQFDSCVKTQLAHSGIKSKHVTYYPSKILAEKWRGKTIGARLIKTYLNSRLSSPKEKHSFATKGGRVWYKTQHMFF
jgi:hypothetical protein